MTGALSAAAQEGPVRRALLGIETRLHEAFPPRIFQHEVLPAPLTAVSLSKLGAARAPFVGLCQLGFAAKAQQGRAAQLTLRFGVYLLVRHPHARGRALGDARGPGLAQMLHAAILGLHGWTLPDQAGHGGFGTLEVTEGDTLDGTAWADNDAACASLTVACAASLTASAGDDALRSLAATWELHVTAGGAGTNDAAAAADTIALPGAFEGIVAT